MRAAALVPLVRGLARTALDAAFCDKATRDRIAKKLEPTDA